MGIQCEENWCLYEILKFALWVCLQKCYTALGIAHQSSEIGKKMQIFYSLPSFLESMLFLFIQIVQQTCIM